MRRSCYPPFCFCKWCNKKKLSARPPPPPSPFPISRLSQVHPATVESCFAFEVSRWLCGFLVFTPWLRTVVLANGALVSAVGPERRWLAALAHVGASAALTLAIGFLSGALHGAREAAERAAASGAAGNGLVGDGNAAEQRAAGGKAAGGRAVGQGGEQQGLKVGAAGAKNQAVAQAGAQAAVGSAGRGRRELKAAGQRNRDQGNSNPRDAHAASDEGNDDDEDEDYDDDDDANQADESIKFLVRPPGGRVRRTLLPREGTGGASCVI